MYFREITHIVLCAVDVTGLEQQQTYQHHPTILEHFEHGKPATLYVMLIIQSYHSWMLPLKDWLYGWDSPVILPCLELLLQH